MGTRLVTAASLWLVTALAGCSLLPGGLSEERSGAGAAAPSWAPAPVTARGLRMLAEAGTGSGAAAEPDAGGFALHTVSGDKAFLPGVNLGSTTPLHQPGELAIGRADYRRWFAQMGELGIRVVRIYTIHPPVFYDELAAYNRAHRDSPLYLVQGVYLPDESYVLPGRTLHDAPVDRAFAAELADASAAVHGQLHRLERPGHASGRWTTDVSAWLVAWIAGVEWDPYGVARTDRRHGDAPYRPGRYVRATPDATATERWLAGHLDRLAAAEAALGVSVPVAFVNWPTADPLAHPGEPDPGEDLVSVDANHVRATAAWPAGTFASYHAYPYYPDFLRHEHPDAVDPYAAYLADLRTHHARMPVMVTEVGVPSSLGSAHAGPRGRDQGGHSEAEAMRTDAELLRVVADAGLAGGFVFAWTDEWFKRSWNTMAHQLPAARRQLWHDPLTNEQHFGLVATDSALVPDGARELVGERGPVKYVLARADASYVHLDVTFRTRLPDHLEVTADTVASPAGADYRIDLDPVGGTAQVWVRAELDPLRLEGVETEGTGAWRRYRLLTNRPMRLGDSTLPAEHQEVGALVEGTWDPADAAFDSRATWRVLEDAPEPTIRLRVPWPMLGLADPSSRTALGPGVPAAALPVPGISLGFTVDGETATLDYSWPAWNHVEHTERLKAGVDELAAAFAELGR